MSQKNCMGCKSYPICSKPQKSATYVCEYWNPKELRDALVTGYSMPLEGVESNDDLNQLDKVEASYEEKVRAFFAAPTLVPVDTVVDDSSVPKLPNFFEFCTRSDGLDVEPYPMQVMTMSKLYNDICPRCSNRKVLLDPPVKDPGYRKIRKNITFLEHGVCPSCGWGRAKIINQGLSNNWTQLAAAVGQRGGKSAVAAMGYAYHTHRMLKLQQPAKVYGLLPNQALQASIVAITFQQALESLWQPLHGYLTSAPWFMAYTALLKEYESRTGEELFKLNDTFIVWKHRRIEIRPQSPNVKTLRGRTRYKTGLDEIGWLDQNIDESGGKVKMNAKGIHGALDRSLLTVRSAADKLIKKGYDDVPTGINLNISSVADARDMIMTLYKQSENSKTILGVKKATWEFNPNVPRTDPEIVEAFRNNPVDAARDYGSNPPLTSNGFFSKFSRIKPCFSGKPNGIQYGYKVRKLNDGTKTRYITPLKIRKGKRPSILAMDAGYSSNSFGFACGSLTEDGIPRIDLVGECMPRPDIVVNHSLVLSECFSKIFEARNVKLLGSDRWQNIKFLQDADMNYGVPGEPWRLSYVEMQEVRQRLWDGELILPGFDFDPEDAVEDAEQGYPNCFEADPMRHLVLQFQTVRDTGSDVVKGVRLTDDMWRAIAMCSTMLIDQRIQDEYLQDDAPETVTSGNMILGQVFKGKLVNVRTGQKAGGQSGGGGGVISTSQGALGAYRKH